MCCIKKKTLQNTRSSLCGGVSIMTTCPQLLTSFQPSAPNTLPLLSILFKHSKHSLTTGPWHLPGLRTGSLQGSLCPLPTLPQGISRPKASPSKADANKQQRKQNSGLGARMPGCLNAAQCHPAERPLVMNPRLCSFSVPFFPIQNLEKRRNPN